MFYLSQLLKVGLLQWKILPTLLISRQERQRGENLASSLYADLLLFTTSHLLSTKELLTLAIS